MEEGDNLNLVYEVKLPSKIERVSGVNSDTLLILEPISKLLLV